MLFLHRVNPPLFLPTIFRGGCKNSNHHRFALWIIIVDVVAQNPRVVFLFFCAFLVHPRTNCTSTITATLDGIKKERITGGWNKIIKYKSTHCPEKRSKTSWKKQHGDFLFYELSIHNYGLFYSFFWRDHDAFLPYICFIALLLLHCVLLPLIFYDGLTNDPS